MDRVLSFKGPLQFYMDPPYWGTEGYGVEFGLEQYGLMAEAMGIMKGKAVVSVNDIPEMREAFKGFPMRQVAINYSVGGASRPRAPKSELIITNFAID